MHFADNWARVFVLGGSGNLVATDLLDDNFIEALRMPHSGRIRKNLVVNLIDPKQRHPHTP